LLDKYTYVFNILNKILFNLYLNMLSLEEGVPIAKIIKSRAFKSKDGKSKYLGLISPEELEKSNVNPGFNIDPYQLITEDEVEKEIGSRNTRKVRKSMREKIKNRKKTGNRFILNDGMLSPVPNIEKERDVLYVSGPSGAGKSTFLAEYLDNYVDMFPENNIYIFSAVNHDPAFKHLERSGKMIRIVLDEEYLEDINDGDGIEVTDLYNSAAVFDDIDVITNTTIRNQIIQLRSECLEIGRHSNVTTCCTTHQLCNFKATKILLQEATKVVVFPRSGSTYHIKRFLKEYCGLNAAQIQEFLNLPSRWVMICKEYPQYVLARDCAYLL
jgi:hypothetical protein